MIEWLAHDAIIEAADVAAARAEAERLWQYNDEHQRFRFDDCGLDGIEVQEVAP